MIRSSASKALFLAAATLLAGAVGASCNSKRDTASSHDVGSVSLALRLSSGVNVDKVDYKISGNGITPITGSVTVSDPGATVSILVNGIPAGTGYTVELSAVSTDGKTTCAGSAKFDVIAGKTTAVTVALQCRAGANTGSVSISGTFNNCPAVTSLSAAPLTVSVGGVIAVSAAGADLDAMDTVTFAWSATGGSFASATSASTSYTCSVGGKQTLTVKVSDGKCDDSGTVEVNCVALLCGNGTLDAGEECDDGNTRAGDGCSDACTIEPICGNSKLERGEECDPPDGTTCDAACKKIIPVCGNGKIEPGETCEPPNTATCDAACHTISACTGCETTKCSGLGCSTVTGAKRTACEALLACARTSKCAASGPEGCYCGTADPIACLSGMANGACKGQVETAAETTNPITISERFVDPSFGTGAANNLLQCDQEFCSNECR
jgi:cysteine-rich repeat protein